MSRILVKPAFGKKLRNPETKQHLPEDGEMVTKSPYWTRRIQECDALVVESKVEEIKEVKTDKQILKQGDK